MFPSILIGHNGFNMSMSCFEPVVTLMLQFGLPSTQLFVSGLHQAIAERLSYFFYIHGLFQFYLLHRLLRFSFFGIG